LGEATPLVYQGVFYRGYNNGLKSVVGKLREKSLVYPYFLKHNTKRFNNPALTTVSLI